MPYGVGGALAEGIRSGFEMGRQTDQDRRRQEALDFEHARQTQADTRAQQQSDLALLHSQLAATQSQRADIHDEGQNYLTQYGDPTKIPPDIQADYTARTKAVNDAHQSVLAKLGPQVQATRQQGLDDVTHWATGDFDPTKVPPARLAMAITAASRRPATDFIPEGDKPAPVLQNAKDFRDGLEQNNQGMMLRGMNGLFAPELRMGLGQPSHHGGGVVMSRQIVGLAPVEGQQGRVMPIVRVFVGPGGENGPNYSHEGAAQGTEQSQYGAPQGATGHYDAPIDEENPGKHIDMAAAFNRIGQMESFATAMAAPDMQARIVQGVKDAGSTPDDFLRAFYATGKVPAKQVTTENVKVGDDTIRFTKNPAGQEIGRETLTGTHTAKPNPFQQRIDAIRADPNLSDDQKQKAIEIQYGLEAKAKAPTAASGSLSLATAGLTPEQNAALFGPGGAVTSGRLDINRINSRTARLFADAEMTNPGVDFSRISSDIQLSRNPTFRQKANLLEVLPEIMDNMVVAGKKVGFSDIRTIGKMQAWVKGKLNDPDMTEYMGQRNDALMAIAGVMRSVGMSDYAHKAEVEVAAPTMSPDALDAWMRGQMKSLEPRLRINRAVIEHGAAKTGSAGTPSGRLPAAGGTAAEVPHVNAKGWTLQRDAQGNRAYVSPDRKQFEEVP